MAGRKTWKGPDSHDKDIKPTEIRLRDVTPQREAKVKKLLKRLTKEEVVEVADIV